MKEFISFTLSLIQEFEALFQEYESTNCANIARRMVFGTSTVTAKKPASEIKPIMMNFYDLQVSMFDTLYCYCDEKSLMRNGTLKYTAPA